ncbi:alpha/beta hydrolase family protein [Luteimonas sp. MHLX1A]|uniref:alpha/beta hydrolase family protein n=1 Tax=Alterluteimonas muca TaxID=2878684 RepID=UPI001E5567AD|nr:alpha/beta hydrolase [Luteimonas sp. MHLX1A]MCD9045647.1 alpha/beta fold hydrolase [Luteimonas sp. MHLX1A]
MKHSIILVVLVLLAACSGNAVHGEAGARVCRSGIYRAADGETLVLTPTTNDGYRWRMLDGRTGALQQEDGQWRSTLGWTGEPDGFIADLANCAGGELRLGPAEAPASFARAHVQVVETGFESDGVTLAGRLLMPPGGEAVPLAVFVHGSGDYSSREYEAYPWALAAQDVAVFVYDKRGTGASEGRYTQDFHVLAADARAALAEARRLAGDRASSTGFLGISQGGWVAPLAASRADVDFVVALYGLLVTPLEEDRLEVMQSLAHAGWGEVEQARGAALSDAAGAVIASNFSHGFSELQRLRRQYREEPWYEDLEGEFTPELLRYPGILLRMFGPMRNRGTTWNHDPLPVVRSLHVPQFWMIAANDTEAPPEVTVSRICALQAEGLPIDLAIYPGADHGMVLTGRTGAAVRTTGHVHDYYPQVAHWIRSRDLGYARAAGAQVHEAVRAP